MNRLSACTLAALLVTFAPHARADATTDARAHFDRGAHLYEEQDYRSALIEFRRAYETSPHWSVLFNIGQASYQLLEYADALRAFERYLRDGGASIPPNRRAVAEKEIAELRERVGFLAFRGAEEGVEIAVDDVIVGKMPFAKPILVSAGRRKITATASGRAPLVRFVDVAGGDAQDVKIDLPPLAIAATPPPAPAPSPVPVAPPRTTSPIAYVGLGVGVVGVGVGTAFGILALGHRASLDRECPAKQCAPSSQSLLDRLQRDSAIATASFAVGAVGLVTGLVLLVSSGGGEAPPAPQQARIEPWLGASQAGLRGSF